MQCEVCSFRHLHLGRRAARGWGFTALQPAQPPCTREKHTSTWYLLFQLTMHTKTAFSHVPIASIVSGLELLAFKDIELQQGLVENKS